MIKQNQILTEFSRLAILSRIANGWVVCGRCQHKLGRVIGKPSGLEIKCHSCKAINIIEEEQNG